MAPIPNPNPTRARRTAAAAPTRPRPQSFRPIDDYNFPIGGNCNWQSLLGELPRAGARAGRRGPAAIAARSCVCTVYTASAPCVQYTMLGSGVYTLYTYMYMPCRPGPGAGGWGLGVPSNGNGNGRQTAAEFRAMFSPSPLGPSDRWQQCVGEG